MRQIINDSFDASILATINSVLGMELVHLPGMMTSQIFAGISPLTAINYQIAVMIQILGGGSVIIFVQLGYKTFLSNVAN
ncbi:hypothetical protein FC23_GL000614 [Lactobacillus psittaci DSM 15354]|uniref:Uncharacterized protein n=1 Tax=Lactobacillus psittaci DSM 15354 TaxID=1122152 RepID=A0A0R1S4Z9_9LACO|nr:hypothetical protein FC23_GL000614 [Lactobacillus psittaci DSM 15354]